MSNHLFVHDVDKWKRNSRSREIDSADVHSYENAIVLPPRENPEFQTFDGVYQGGVCSSNFDFIAGCVRKYGSRHTNLNCDESYTVPKEDIIYRDETVIFGGCLIGHFGHALLDSTARFWYLLQAPQDLKIVFVRYHTSSVAYFDALKFVELMGINMDRVEVITEPTQFREVIIPDQAVYGINAYRPEHVATFDQIRRRITPHQVRKIYLSRTNFNFKASLNEEYYEQFFSRRGYKIIHPEQLPIEEQIAYISGADDIVVMIGSMSHLLLFAKETANITILNRSREFLTQQIIVDQVRNIQPYYIDAFISPLPTTNSGPFLFGPNRFFRAYLDERGISYEPEELEMDKESLCSMTSTFIEEWTNLYIGPNSSRSPGKYRKKEIFRYGEDYMRTVAYLTGDDVDDPDDFLFTQTLDLQSKQIKELKADNVKLRDKNTDLKKTNTQLKKANAKLTSDLKKSRAEITRLRNSKSWKITAPLRKITRLLEDR